jgi:DNA-binding HxlR family transcriptional regulator
MPDYGTYCPVAMASEVVADRWNPLIIRELVLGNTRFNDIARAMPGISRSLLVQRLRHMEKKGVLETWPSATGHGSEYHLTPAGRDLERVLDSLARWAIEWLFDDLRPHDVPPTLRGSSNYREVGVTNAKSKPAARPLRRRFRMSLRLVGRGLLRPLDARRR